MDISPNNVKITILWIFFRFWLIARCSCEMSSEMTNFPYFRAPQLLISQKGRAISQKWQIFQTIVIFTLFGLISINKNGSKHYLRIAPKKAHLTPTPSLIHLKNAQKSYLFLSFRIFLKNRHPGGAARRWNFSAGAWLRHTPAIGCGIPRRCTLSDAAHFSAARHH